jgi:syntaxin 5
MKESKDRTEQFMSSTAAAATQSPTSKAAPFLSQAPDAPRRHLPQSPSSESLLFAQSRPDSRTDVKGKGKGRATLLPDGELLAVDLASAEEGLGMSNGNGYQQMQLVEQQVRPTSVALHSHQELIWYPI